MKPGRRAFLLSLAAGAALGARAAPAPLTAAQRLADFDELWEAIDRGYPYFGTSRPDWRRARDAWRGRAQAAGTRADFLAALEGALERLREDHLWMSEHSPASPRRVPGETDIWAAWRNDAAVIEAVRTYGDADVAGLHPGQVIRSIGGLPAAAAVRDRLGAAGNAPEARDWALRHVLAGPRDGTLRLEVAGAQGAKPYEIERKGAAAGNGPALIARRVGEARDLGYVRLKAGLSDPALVARFDGALHYVADTRAMILDLRDATGPFEDPASAQSAAVALLARFAPSPRPWQVREGRDGGRIVDSVAPRPQVYAAPLVVLVDRWTAGSGEALASGLRSVARARLVGTRMAGLHGELRVLELRHSGVKVGFPYYRTFDTGGVPRESLRPDVLVDLAAPQGGPGDPILYQALKLLEK